MANRILRDWTFSENIDLLSYEAESFFTRLIMKADDYGRFHATEKLLKAALYPLRDVPLKTIAKMLTECVNVGVVFCYEVNGKLYLEIPNFGQRLRQMNSRFPEPLTIDRSALTIDRQPPLEGRKELEDETEGKKLETSPTPKGEVKDNIPKFLTWYNSQVEKISGKPGKTKTLSKTDVNNLRKLRESYVDISDWNIVFYNMWNSSWCIENNQRTVTHLLRVDNFNKYLSQGDNKKQMPSIRSNMVLDHD